MAQDGVGVMLAPAERLKSRHGKRPPFRDTARVVADRKIIPAMVHPITVSGEPGLMQDNQERDRVMHDERRVQRGIAHSHDHHRFET